MKMMGMLIGERWHLRSSDSESWSFTGCVVEETNQCTGKKAGMAAQTPMGAMACKMEGGSLVTF